MLGHLARGTEQNQQDRQWRTHRGGLVAGVEIKCVIVARRAIVVFRPAEKRIRELEFVTQKSSWR